ncbi:MAG: pyridoxamine 5'-phosphate oxidase [Bacteroidota bacterium]
MKSLTNEEITMLRVDYTLKEFDEKDVADNPIEQFRTWFTEAVDAHVNEPNAMTLATVKKNNTPSARIVLLKGFSDKGFTFFTNYDSHKGEQISANPNVALVFCWLELQRQVRIEGVISKISEKESDAYFHSRPLGSQIGAIASPQSRIIISREVLEKEYKVLEKKLEHTQIQRPANWGGYVVKPKLVEFWQGRTSRLHDRLEFKLNEDTWVRNRLAP